MRSSNDALVAVQNIVVITAENVGINLVSYPFLHSDSPFEVFISTRADLFLPDRLFKQVFDDTISVLLSSIEPLLENNTEVSVARYRLECAAATYLVAHKTVRSAIDVSRIPFLIVSTLALPLLERGEIHVNNDISLVTACLL